MVLTLSPHPGDEQPLLTVPKSILFNLPTPSLAFLHPFTYVNIVCHSADVKKKVPIICKFFLTYFAFDVFGVCFNKGINKHS
jgi:hypothetical protein